MREMSGCPDPSDLEGFVLGTIDGEDFARIADHVERCGDCARSLDALDGLCDPLVTRISLSTLRPEPAATPLPRPLLHALRAGSWHRRQDPWGAAGGPRRIGKFELLEEVGVGSFGHVFRARDTELGRVVAIKIPRAGILAGGEDVDRFLREARSAAHLTHPGIV